MIEARCRKRRGEAAMAEPTDHGGGIDRVANLNARPEPIPLGASSTAVVINDMQNAFCSPGGYLDRLGFDLAGAEGVIDAVARVLAAARRAGLPVFHSQNGFAADFSDAPADSPWWHKSPALRLMRERPELAGQVLVEGSWDFDFVARCAPAEGEIVIRKSRPSCFAGTALDAQLRARRIRAIVVLGIASNVGVEWTLREGLSREYYGIMVRDATMPAGPAQIQDAVVFNIERFVGWTTTRAEFEEICAAWTSGAAGGSAPADGVRPGHPTP